MSSEFGKGLVYPIGLFLAHADRYSLEKREYEKSGAIKYIKDRMPEMWFNASSDHLYELDTSTLKSKALTSRINSWKTKCLNWGHGFPKVKSTEGDVLWAIQEAKDILLKLDKTFGVKAQKGVWE